MAAPGNFGTYGFGFLAGTGANREDLLDLITNVDPWDTPWVTQAPKVRASHVVHEWLVDTLATTSTASGVVVAIEGDDWAYNTATTRPTRVTNNTMIFRKDISVSETQRAVNPAGFKDAYSYEIAKATKELARNIEVWLFHGNATVTGTAISGASNAVRRMLGFQGFIATTATGAGQTVSSLGTATNNSAPLTQGNFNDALERCFLNGGNPEQVYVSSAIKRQISGFNLTGQNRNIGAIEKKLVNAIDIYVSDVGVVEVVLDRWVPQATNAGTATASATDTSGNMFFLERAKNRLAWLRPMQHTLVGKRGDSVAGTILGELTLEVLNEKAAFRINRVNNATA
jgi:hypothetical protein